MEREPPIYTIENIRFRCAEQLTKPGRYQAGDVLSACVSPKPRVSQRHRETYFVVRIGTRIEHYYDARQGQHAKGARGKTRARRGWHVASYSYGLAVIPWDFDQFRVLQVWRTKKDAAAGLRSYHMKRI